VSRERIRKWVAAAALTAALPGCAFSEGEAYGVLDASLEAGYERLDERARGDGFEATSADFEVKIDTLTLGVDSLSLVLGALGDGPITFDPANPPEGYSLCHNGHCHNSDGALVDYATIEAEQSAAAGSSSVTLSGGTSDILAGAPLALSCGDEAECILGEGRVSLLELRFHELALSGEVRDGRPPALARFEGTRAFAATVDLLHDGAGEPSPGEKRLPADLPLSDDEPPRITLVLSLTATAALLDGVDFAALVTAGSGDDIALDEPAAQAAAAARILQNFAEVDIQVTVVRTVD
jgi:hypothetical protein